MWIYHLRWRPSVLGQGVVRSPEWHEDNEGATVPVRMLRMLQELARRSEPYMAINSDDSVKKMFRCPLCGTKTQFKGGK